MKLQNTLRAVLVALPLSCVASHAADVTWTGSVSYEWEQGANWDNSIGPERGDVAIINSGSAEYRTGPDPSLKALRLSGGSLTLAEETFSANSPASLDDPTASKSQVGGTLIHANSTALFSELEIGGILGDDSFYYLNGGSLSVSSGLASVALGLPGHSLMLGANLTGSDAGTGAMAISGGGLSVSDGVKLGDGVNLGTGNFSVFGTAISHIEIATATGDADGTWMQHAGSTLQVGIDLGGVRTIRLTDSSAAASGTSATFENGSLLDVDYFNGGAGGGTWTVMEVENGDVIDNGLTFAPGVDLGVWSFSINNSGANGLLQVTAAGTPITGNVFWDGSESSAWETGGNWDNDLGPGDGNYAYITFGSVDFAEATGTSENLRGLRLFGGTLNLSGGLLKATKSSSAESHVNANFNQTGGAAEINELEIGQSEASNGAYFLTDGELKVARARSGYSLYLGANSGVNDAGNGSLQITAGSLVTRTGVKLGDTTKTGTGLFSVLGSASAGIGIASSNGDFDGHWLQHAGSTLRIGIDAGGVTQIFIDDSSSSSTGTSATFESGSLLDVDYFSTGGGGGTWTVMFVENGDVIDNGLAFAAGVDTDIWSFSIDNSGPHGILQVTAAGDPQGIALDVGGTEKQMMRYGLDYERLWYWTGSLNASEKDTVSKWSVVDCDIDYIRVAINSKYELEEGVFDLSAYTSKIWPMMHDMQDANPDIKFFASPRPLNEAVSGARWQPYPKWVTGDNGSSFNFDSQKCGEYLVRYVELMKTEGFQISFIDLTNEWNFVTPTHVRDIRAYLAAQLDPADMPLIIAPSAWSYAQGSSWLDDANTTAKTDAIDISASHNTDKTGTAEDFANKSIQILGPDKEIWNTELHGWKSTSGADEVLTSSFMFEAIRAGFSGLSGWLAIGTKNQGHCYILNPSGTPSRNVKYFIFKKLSTTSNYGHALDINQPTEFESTAALIRGNLMTVWVANDSSNSQPVIITPSGRTISEDRVRRTIWSESLPIEGLRDHISTTGNTSVASTIAGNSLYCFEILLDPEGAPFAKIEAEGFDANSGTTSEANGDTDGTLNVGHIEHGDWTRYDNIAPGNDSVMRFRVARPGGRPDGWIEVRLDDPQGPLIGRIAVPETGGWQTYETIETSLDPVVGSHSIFLRFAECGGTAGSSLFNLNWFSLIMPVPPTGLASTPASESQIDLTWDAAPGSTSYTLKRSTTSGGPYATIASGLTGTSYTDADLTTGAAYYYVISAIYPEGESSNSAETLAVPSAPLIARRDAYTGFRIGTLDFSGIGQADGFILAGGTGTTLFEVDASSGEISVIDSASLASAPATSYPLLASATVDGETVTLTININLVAADAIGFTGIDRQIFTNYTDTLAALPIDPRFPHLPEISRVLSSFDAGFEGIDSFASRIRAYVVPPTSGPYRFYISSDDDSSLLLSSDDNPANASEVASVATAVDPRSFTDQLSQASDPVNLTAGQRYYIESLHRQDIGSDDLAVAWTTPTNPVLPAEIPGSALEAFDFNAAPTWDNAPFAFTVVAGSAPGTEQGSIAASDPEADQMTYAILSGDPAGAFAIDPITGALRVADGTALTADSPVTLSVGAQDAGVDGAYPLQVIISTAEIEVISELTAEELEWRGEHFAQADLDDPAKESTVWGRDANPDGDGWSNFAELAFGGDPNDDTSTLDNVLTWIYDDATDKFTATFPRLASGLLDYTLEFSNDLEIWDPASATEGAAAAIDSRYETASFTEDSDTASVRRRFVTISVSDPASAAPPTRLEGATCGYYHFLPPGGSSAWTAGLVKPRSHAGVIDGIAGSVLTESEGNFVDDALIGSFIEILAPSAHEGAIFDIISNTTTTITVNTDLVAYGLSGSENFAVREHVTLGAMLPGGGGLQPPSDSLTLFYPDGSSKTFLLVDLGGGNINWFLPPSTLANDEVIYPAQGFLIQTDDPRDLLIGQGGVGKVKFTPTIAPAYAGVTTLVGLVNPLVSEDPGAPSTIRLADTGLLDTLTPSTGSTFSDESVTLFGRSGGQLSSSGTFFTFDSGSGAFFYVPPATVADDEPVDIGSAFSVDVDADKLYRQEFTGP